jgi:hypothetical protein
MSFSSDNPLVSNQLPISIDFPKDLENLRTVLSDNYKKTANIINTKEGALYLYEEIASFKQLSNTTASQPFINCYRKTFDLIALNGGNIGAGATVSFAHGISSLTKSILIYVSARSTGPEYFTAVYPYCWLDATQLHFMNPSASSVSQAIFVAEYTKNE